MSRRIKSISYLRKFKEDGKTVYKREHCHALSGKFFLAKKCSKRANGRVQTRLTAYDFIINENVSLGDPFLTLDDGYKIRVFQGGDKSYMLAEAKSLIELHDLEFKALKKKAGFIPEDKCEAFDLDDYDFPWPGIP